MFGFTAIIIRLVLAYSFMNTIILILYKPAIPTISRWGLHCPLSMLVLIVSRPSSALFYGLLLRSSQLRGERVKECLLTGEVDRGWPKHFGQSRSSFYTENSCTISIDGLIFRFGPGGSCLCWVVILLHVRWINFLFKLLTKHGGGVDIIHGGFLKEDRYTWSETRVQVKGFVYFS